MSGQRTRIAKSSRELAAVRVRESISPDPPLTRLVPEAHEIDEITARMLTALHGLPPTDCDMNMITVVEMVA